MQRRLSLILAGLYLASPCIARAGGEVPAAKKELSNVFIGMKRADGARFLRSLGEEIFTTGVTIKSLPDGSIEQRFGDISAGWRIDERVVVRLSADEEGKVTAIGLYDARAYYRSKDAFASSREEVSSLVFIGRELVMRDGKLLEKEPVPAPAATTPVEEVK